MRQRAGYPSPGASAHNRVRGTDGDAHATGRTGPCERARPRLAAGRCAGGAVPDHLARARIPEPGDDEVRVKVRWIGVCGSDVEIYRGTRRPEWLSLPARLGHKVAGVINKLGAHVYRLPAPQTRTVEVAGEDFPAGFDVVIHRVGRRANRRTAVPCELSDPPSSCRAARLLTSLRWGVPGRRSIISNHIVRFGLQCYVSSGLYSLA